MGKRAPKEEAFVEIFDERGDGRREGAGDAGGVSGRGVGGGDVGCCAGGDVGCCAGGVSGRGTSVDCFGHHLEDGSAGSGEPAHGFEDRIGKAREGGGEGAGHHERDRPDKGSDEPGEGYDEEGFAGAEFVAGAEEKEESGACCHGRHCRYQKCAKTGFSIEERHGRGKQ